MAYKNIKTHKKGYLEVDKHHKIYYELSGNPKGKPILFVHGGPGGGFSEKDKRYFNPRIFNMIHFDQRGSGKSKPFASLKNNTTYQLVKDMKKLLDHLNIKKTFVFGGSWGSTLSLVYAISYPKTVAGLIIRGVFLASKKENNYFTYIAKNKHPESWEKLASLVPPKYIKKKQIEKYYYKKILSKDKKTSHKYAFAWAEYEASISSLVESRKKVKKFLKDVNPKAFSKIELHYLTHLCFLPKNYILKNIGKIKNIPAVIIHGRYDCVCSPLSAFLIHKKLPKSELFFTLAGHSSSDPENENLLVKETNKMSKLKI